MSGALREPSWKREQARRQRARRRLALVVGGVFAVALVVLLTLVVRRLDRDKPAAVAEPPLTTAAAEPAGDAIVATPSQPESADAELEDEMAAMAVPETAAVETAELWGPPDPFTRITGVLQPGDTFGTALDNAGVAPATTQKIIQTLRGTLDFRRVRPQDKFDLVVDAGGALLEFAYERGLDEIYRIDPRPERWVPIKEKRQFDTQLALVRGEVASTLFDAIAAAGEQDALIMSFVEIFAWAIDFSVFTRKGDTFTMLVEKLYDKGVFRGYGRILAAEYVNAGEVYDATYFEAPDGFSGYFDSKGRNLRRAFLRAPLRFNAITSSFTYSRFHPVLKFRRPHLGIDYAAPTGTPIWSVADGVVTAAGWMGGSGRAVKIRHRNGIETSYSHLSRFGPGIRAGRPVRQKQVIGYVGATGLATGPHLHFGMKVNGRAVNPATMKLPAGDPVPRKYIELFQQERTHWLAEVNARKTAAAGVVPASARN